MKTCFLYLIMIHALSCIYVVSLNPTFENMLRKHHLDDETIEILKEQKLVDIAAVRGLTESDMRDLGLPIGQKVLLKELVIKLRASSGDKQQQFFKDKPAGNSESEENNQSVEKDLGRREKFEGDDKENTDEKTKGPDTSSRNKDTGDGKEMNDDKENTDEKTKGPDTSSRNKDTSDGKEMNEEQFWCIFKCLGGISAVGIGGILTLIGLVTYGLPFIGFGAAGIVAGSLAAKIMALYGGAVAAGSVVSVLQSVAMAGIGWKAILGAFFGPAAVMTAVEKTCSHCMDL